MIKWQKVLSELWRKISPWSITAIDVTAAPDKIKLPVVAIPDDAKFWDYLKKIKDSGADYQLIADKDGNLWMIKIVGSAEVAK